MAEMTSEIEPLLLPVWPDAGKMLGFRTRSATYDAVSKGQIPVVRFGRRMMVAKKTLERIAAGEAA
jgi:hypothetical protein